MEDDALGHFVHEGFLYKKMLFGWRRYYCVLRGRTLELYRPGKCATMQKKSEKPNRVLIIATYNTDYRQTDQIELVNPRGTKRYFRFNTEQLQLGERVQWLQALQTAFLVDNALEKYGPNVSNQLLLFVKKQMSEKGKVLMDDGIRQTLRKRSIHGDLWGRFQILVQEGIQIEEICEAKSVLYLFRLDDPPKSIILLPMRESDFICDDIQTIELNMVVSVAFSHNNDAVQNLTRFSLTCLVDGETSVTRTFDALRTEVRSLLVFGLSQIIRNLQYSPKLEILRRLTLARKNERASFTAASSEALLAINMNGQRDAVIRGFNVNPAKAIGNAIEQKIMRDISIRSPDDARVSIERCVALFLRHTKGLDKDKIGEYLGNDDHFSLRVLEEFSHCFEFGNKPFEVCLREFISKFRLPGEGQKIDRIMEAFAKAFHAANPTIFLHHDGAHILAFSTIMLNTDAHNPSMGKRPRMTRQEFVHNNRGIDKDNANVPAAILESIYDSVKRQPLVTLRDRDDNGNLFSNPEICGWLKNSRLGGKWAWFIVTTHCLYFFDDQQDIDPLGFYSLENVSIRKIRQTQFELVPTARKIKGVTYPQRRRGASKVASTSSSKLLLHQTFKSVGFTVESEAERDEWVAVLEKNVLKNEVCVAHRSIFSRQSKTESQESSQSTPTAKRHSISDSGQSIAEVKEKERPVTPRSPREFTAMA
ncbi:cytohesin-4 [Thraustotheca clavata]|uniref:Cytohesin-4 n=1 Tax=Thraustotheca clavata TaxID=74557 RepID=A0A1W0AAV6_9STRA|nr:cytohesin-4 [Thraustotheca clavata]